MFDHSIGNSFAGKMPCADTVLIVGGTFQKRLRLSSGFNRGVGGLSWRSSFQKFLSFKVRFLWSLQVSRTRTDSSWTWARSATACCSALPNSRLCCRTVSRRAMPADRPAKTTRELDVHGPYVEAFGTKVKCPATLLRVRERGLTGIPVPTLGTRIAVLPFES